MRGPRSRWLLLLLAQHALPSLAELTAQEAHECRAQPELIAFELRGGWVLEIALMFAVALFMYVLIEEYYVPALELICTKEVLNIPKPIVGCTVMAAGNCLPELSISLVAILANGQDIGTGEVLGSCVFDLLAMLGVVCMKLPKEGARMPLPLVLYFMAWVVIATMTDLLLFFTTAEITWVVACVMVLLYVLFCAGVALLNALFDLSEAVPELTVDPESPWNQQDPMEPAPPKPRRDPSLSAQKESSQLLASPRGAGAAPTASEGRSWERRAYEWWGGLHSAALAPPRFLFTHTASPSPAPSHRRTRAAPSSVLSQPLAPSQVPKPDKPIFWGRRLWPLTVFMCILYTLVLSFPMVRRPPHPSPPAHPPHPKRGPAADDETTPTLHAPVLPRPAPLVSAGDSHFALGLPARGAQERAGRHRPVLRRRPARPDHGTRAVQPARHAHDGRLQRLRSLRLQRVRRARPAVGHPGHLLGHLPPGQRHVVPGDGRLFVLRRGAARTAGIPAQAAPQPGRGPATALRLLPCHRHTRRHDANREATRVIPRDVLCVHGIL